MAVVLNQAQFSKLVHEVTYTRPCGADQLSKRLLANFCDNRLGSTFLAKIRQQKKRSCQSLFGRIEQLIDQVLFNSNSARQEVRRTSPKRLARHGGRGSWPTSPAA